MVDKQTSASSSNRFKSKDIKIVEKKNSTNEIMSPAFKAMDLGDGFDRLSQNSIGRMRITADGALKYTSASKKDFPRDDTSSQNNYRDT